MSKNIVCQGTAVSGMEKYVENAWSRCSIPRLQRDPWLMFCHSQPWKWWWWWCQTQCTMARLDLLLFGYGDMQSAKKWIIQNKRVSNSGRGCLNRDIKSWKDEKNAWNWHPSSITNLHSVPWDIGFDVFDRCTGKSDWIWLILKRKDPFTNLPDFPSFPPNSSHTWMHDPPQAERFQHEAYHHIIHWKKLAPQTESKKKLQTGFLCSVNLDLISAVTWASFRQAVPPIFRKAKHPRTREQPMKRKGVKARLKRA